MSMLDWAGSSLQDGVELWVEDGLCWGPSLNWEETLLTRDVSVPLRPPAPVPTADPTMLLPPPTTQSWRHREAQLASGHLLRVVLQTGYGHGQYQHTAYDCHGNKGDDGPTGALGNPGYLGETPCICPLGKTHHKEEWRPLILQALSTFSRGGLRMLGGRREEVGALGFSGEAGREDGEEDVRQQRSIDAPLHDCGNNEGYNLKKKTKMKKQGAL
ncbi:hypothetical protein EYF80_012352 [Liparis tanakae]|uniref:Uncharacterized protein n=1 Tax=Liparis tanakae TaxID=230148 RepID=A0A4Z2IHR8_9TELE|nr:hypothetical protein EYF80_012352 [Liparis tanakae]